jgi:pre-rRNA-processing protein TSR4
MYTPEDEPAEAYHRMLYVFVCENNLCHQESRLKCIKVFRSQLPKENKYYSIDREQSPSTEEGVDEDDIVWKLNSSINPDHYKCPICGLHGNKQCSKCKRVKYCSRAHQLEHWGNGHKTQCTVLATQPDTPNFPIDKLTLGRFAYPEHYLVSEPEMSEEEMKEAEEKTIKDTLDRFRVEEEAEMEANKTALVKPGEEEYENTETGVDKTFLKFQKRVEYDSDQVLRYVRTFYDEEDTEVIDENSEPLWVSDINQLSADEIPNCPNCSQPRKFELQLLPQILNYLNLDFTMDRSLDYGTLLIYSCNKNCSSTEPGEEAYQEEFVWEQPFSADGIGENIRKNHFNM